MLNKKQTTIMLNIETRKQRRVLGSNYSIMSNIYCIVLKIHNN